MFSRVADTLGAPLPWAFVFHHQAPGRTWGQNLITGSYLWVGFLDSPSLPPPHLSHPKPIIQKWGNVPQPNQHVQLYVSVMQPHLEKHHCSLTLHLWGWEKRDMSSFLSVSYRSKQPMQASGVQLLARHHTCSAYR